VNKLNVTMLQGKQMLCSCWYTLELMEKV